MTTKVMRLAIDRYIQQEQNYLTRLERVLDRHQIAVIKGLRDIFMFAFTPPFVGAFAKTFDPALAAVGAIPWYLADGGSITNVLAAHQSLGAANLAASYDDIAHEATTWDCAPGTAPTFDASYGWDFTAASSQYLEVGSGAIASAVPVTMLVLFQSTSIVSFYALASIADTAAKNFFSIGPAGSITGDPVIAYVAQTTEVYAKSSTGYTANNWFVGAAVFSANNARAAYIDGGSKGTDTTAKTPAGLDTTYIGCSHSGANRVSHLNGKIAADAWFNVAKSDAEVLALSNAMLALVA